MPYYYVALMSRSQVFLLERRMQSEGVMCEPTYMPRELMNDLCSMGVKFRETELKEALRIMRRSGFPGCRLYKEIMSPYDCTYEEVKI